MSCKTALIRDLVDQLLDLGVTPRGVSDEQVDAALLERHRGGDGDARELLARRYRPRLARYIALRAPGAVEEVLARVEGDLDSVIGTIRPESVKAFLYWRAHRARVA